MKNKKYLLILFSTLFVITLSGCTNSKKIDYDIDGQISSLVEKDSYYPEEVLNEELQEKLIEEQVNNEDIILDHTLINFEGASNKLPMEHLLIYPKSYFEGRTLDWFGIAWGITAYENTEKDMVSALKLKVVYDINDLDFAKRKSRELADKFLKTYNNIVYTDNIYEYDFSKLEYAPIRVIADVKGEDLYAVLNIGIFHNTFDDIKTPYTEIVFVHKEHLHDISDYELNEIINYMKTCLNSVNIKPNFNTIKLDPYNGYIIEEHKSEEDKTPEEKLNSGVIFYK